MPEITQPSFSKGEIAPELYGRIDQEDYYTGLRKARNVSVSQYGGVYNRGGTHFIAPVKDFTKPPRLIAFQFKTIDTHQIELGDRYIRFLRNEGHITETAKNITAATQADPTVLTIATHGYSSNDEVALENIGGMIQLNGRRFKITVLDADTFSLQDVYTGGDVDSTTYGAYTSGGTAAKIYEIASPYLQADLFNIKISQTADVMTLAHPSYPTKDLTRLALANWTLTTTAFVPTHSAPTTLAASAGTHGSTVVKYTVTAIEQDTKEESSTALTTDASQTITAATQANPVVLTLSADADLATGDEILIENIVGMTELNGRRFKVIRLTTTTVSLQREDGTDYGAYVSGGTFKRAFVRLSNSSTTFDNTITFTAVPNTIRYAVYRNTNGAFAFIGETENTSFKDSNLQANAQISTPFPFNPFRDEDDYPGAVGFHQQRRVLGGSNNKPDTKFYSRLGAFRNFSVTSPVRSEDSFSTTLPSLEVNEIRHFVSLNDLLVFTTGAEWRVTSQGGFSLTGIEQRPQTTWGSAQLPPHVVGSTAIFYTGTAVRSLQFAFNTAGYESGELSLWSPHLLSGKKLTDWTYLRQNVDPIIASVRDDGSAILLTLNEAQQVIGWTTWDTEGEYYSVAASRANVADTLESLFFVVKRSVGGRTVYYIERSDNRTFEDIRDAFFVDSGLSLDDPYTIASITNANPAVLTITGHPFADGDEVDIHDARWETTIDAKGNVINPNHLNNFRYVVDDATTNTITLRLEGEYVDSTNFAAYLGGGQVRKAVDTVSGLRHLAGKDVVALGDGNVIRDLVVSSEGTVTFGRKFSRIHTGLSYISDVETLDLETQQRTIQGKNKKVSGVALRFKDSRGLLIGPNPNRLVEWAQRKFEKWGEPTSLFTGVERITILSEWNSNGRVFLRQIDPLPFYLLGATLDFEVE